MTEPSIDRDILTFYADGYDEDLRIRDGLRQIELIRTREIVRRHLPAGSLRMLDVGGGGGVHAEWLLDDGHSVDLIDPVPRHVQEANQRLSTRPRFSAAVGDARDLPPTGPYDAVLLLGPLYHLVERNDRIRAWSEARRVCRAGGLVFGVGISRFAELAVGLGRGLAFDEDFWEMMLRTLHDGQHRSPANKAFFTTAFYHHPDELEAEAIESGWELRQFVNVEGFVDAVPSLAEHWSDPGKRETILEASRLVETEPTLRGLGTHMMVIAVNPGG